MRSNKLLVGVLLGLLLGPISVFTGERFTIVITKVGARLGFETLTKFSVLSVLSVIVKCIYDLTDDKKFNELSNNVNIDVAMRSLKLKDNELLNNDNIVVAMRSLKLKDIL